VDYGNRERVSAIQLERHYRKVPCNLRATDGHSCGSLDQSDPFDRGDLLMRIARIGLFIIAAIAAAQVPATYRPTTYRPTTYYGNPALRPHRWARDEVRRAHGMTGWQVWPFNVELVCPGTNQRYGYVELDLCLQHGEVKILSSHLRGGDFICGMPMPMPVPIVIPKQP
jgi:hypothetical protein